MRAKSDIIAYLESQLSDDIWKKLRNSLLGRELLAFGAEVISENENVKDTMLLQMNPETADKNGLYMLSQMNEIPITNIKPSTLVVQMENYVKTYAPYELQYNIGNVHFTNIEYTMQGKSVSLINGTHKCWAVGMDMSANSVEGGSETFFYDGTTTYSGIKLGNAYPDSIVVEYEHTVGDVSVVTEMNRYSSDIALSDNVDMMYKVTTGVDGSIYIRFLNGGDTIPNPTTYKIDWLDHSAMEFEIQSNDVMDGNNKVATVQYSSQGVEDDLEFMRQQLKKEMAKYNGLNTPKSVEDYVEGMPYIIDSKCVADNNGLNVYVKPSSDSDATMYLNFSEIAAHISLNSIMFPNIKIAAGRKLNFGVTIGGITEEAIKNNVTSLIQDLYAYDKMGFDSTVNVSQILAEIYNRFGIVPSITMNLIESFRNNEPLCYVPVKNTLKGYDENNQVAMTEMDGVLYGRSSNVPLEGAFDIVCCVGTMVLLQRTKFIDDYEQQEVGSPAKPRYGENISIGNSGSFNTFIKTVIKTDTNSYLQKTVNRKSVRFYGYNYKIVNNRFYLYDVSKNMVKPYDASFIKLIKSVKNPSLKADAWTFKDWENGDSPYPNLLDIEILSINNSIVLNFVFNSNGTILKHDNNGFDKNSYLLVDGQTEYCYRYWNPKNTTSFDYFVNSNNNNKEIVSNYKGKFQTAFCVKSLNNFRNLSMDTWEIDDCYDGDDTAFEGYYKGFKGIKNGEKLDIKSNSFYYNSDLYYLTQIEENKVVLNNRTTNQKITIPIIGTFKGMIERDGILYVIQDKYVSIVEGFDGVRSKNNIVNLQKGLNEPFTIKKIVNGMDKGILIEEFGTNKFYYAKGFESNFSTIMFKDLEQIFTDQNDTSDWQIGSCTSEYVICYKTEGFTTEEHSNMEGVVKNMYFYCWDIKNHKTMEYYTKSHYDYNDQDADVHYGYMNDDSNMGGEQSIIGYMDYGNNKVVNQTGVDINTIKYEGLSAYNTKDTYLVLDENEIKFTN